MYPLNKFFYLRELLILKEKLLIDGVRFISETYIKSNSILIAKNLKPLEIFMMPMFNVYLPLLLFYVLTKFTSMNFMRIQSISMNNFFFFLVFLSRTFTNQMTAGEGGGHFINLLLPLPPALWTFRH